MRSAAEDFGGLVVTDWVAPVMEILRSNVYADYILPTLSRSKLNRNHVPKPAIAFMAKLVPCADSWYGATVDSPE
jgi:hypothetical protein